MRRVPVLLIAAALAAASLGASGAEDPLRDRQYGLDIIDAPGAWPVSRGGDTVIAIVDTGVHLEHPDLASQLLRDREGQVVGFDAVDGRSPEDGHGHGTLVAGTAAAAAGNGIGIASVAPEARLMPIRALNDDGEGTITDVDRGIRWAVDNGADVINLSLESAGLLPGQLVGGGLDAAVRYAWDRGVVVVAAAGNRGSPFTDYSASTPVLLVGATDERDRQTTFSDSGRRDMVLAPGVDIVSTMCDPCGSRGTATYASASGTSFAAPHVAGAVAVLLAQGRSPAEAVAALRDTAVSVPRPATSVQQGHGRIDLGAAVARPRAPRGSTSSAPDRDAPAATEQRTSEPAPQADRTSPDTGATPEPGEAPATPVELESAPDVDDPVGGADASGADLDEAPADDDGAPARDGEATEPVDVPAGEVALGARGDGSRTPGALVLLAGSLVVATTAMTLRALEDAADRSR